MDALLAIREVDFWVVFFGLVLVLVVSKYVLELIEWFCKKYGIKTKTMIEKETDHNTLLQVVKTINTIQESHKKDMQDIHACHKKDIDILKESHDKEIKDFWDKRNHDREQSRQIQKELSKSIKSIEQKLDSIRDENIDKDIGDMRWTIIKFSTDLSNGLTVSRESYDYIFKTYERYEEILKAHGKENGLVDESMQFIREKYREVLSNGST